MITDLKLCDSAVSLLTVRTRVFAAIESLHLIIQLSNKRQTQFALTSLQMGQASTNLKSELKSIILLDETPF